MATNDSRVRIDDLTHAAFSGVLRALEDRDLEPKKWPGPILVGIIAWPELGAPNLPETLPEKVTRVAKRGS